MNHLTSIDASFLHFESPETPMHVGSLMLLELPAGYAGDYYDDVKAVIAERLPRVQAFNRKLAPMPFELADPLWVEDPDIDLDYHVRHHTLRKPGSRVQLEQLVGRLHSSLLDRSRPLWEIYVIEGLEDGRVAVYVKAHHSGIDGKAGIELSKIIYDTSPQMGAAGRVQQRTPASEGSGAGRPVGQAVGMGALLKAGVSNSATQYLKLARLLPRGIKAIATAGRIVAGRRGPGSGRGLNLGLAPRTPFNVPVTNQRAFATMSMPLDEVKALGARVGGTVNTIVMAVCAGALRRFIAERGAMPRKPLLAAVPVSLRAPDDTSANNQVTMVRVDLATDIADAALRFKAIHNSSEGAKALVRELKPILGVDMPVVGSPWLMTGLASLVVRSGLLNALPQIANAVISNVPGIPVPVYLAGARAANFYPVSIPFHGLAINITVQSYAGQLEFGLTACRRALSHQDLLEVIGYMRESLDEIRGFKNIASEAAAAPAAVSPAKGRATTRMRKPTAAPVAPASAARRKRAAPQRA
ncbi:MAG: wax ester/triacylglycerol synthase family O-acyltransferase [Ideonella sp.]|nr:wax ester/triacylglycerol synthase family O-acyltransferase [Ideonella sp.]